MGDIFVLEVKIFGVVQVIKQHQFVEPGTVVGDRLNFKRLIPNRFGFAVFTDDIIYFFEFKPSKSSQDKAGKDGEGDARKGGSNLLGKPKSKGTYHCVLKWRAEEFRDTHILEASICEGPTPQETTMAISTKSAQLIYLNLYTQVYFPDHVKLIQDLKSEEKEETEGSE